MAELSDIRAAIVARLSAVEGMGLVHDHEAYAKDVAKMKQLYVRDGQLNGWQVLWKLTKSLPLAQGANDVRHKWEIRGFMALSEEQGSEAAFDALLDRCRKAFNTSLEVAGEHVLTVLRDEGVAGAQVVEKEPVMFCGVLCHAARLDVWTATQEVTVAPEQGSIPANIHALLAGENL